MRGRRLAAVMVLALAVPPTAAAAERPTTILAFSDAQVLTPAAAHETVVRTLRPKVCRPTARRGTVRGLAAALANVDAALARRVPASALAATRRLSAKALRARAVGAAAADVPAAALAALVALHRREPRDPQHLIGASVFATQLGLAPEAVAMLDAADRLPRPARTPFGLSSAALSRSNRGYALLAMRRWGDAAAVLRQAVRQEPLLAEAQLNLAAARLCAGQVAAAAVAYRAGQRRQSLPETAVDSPGSTAPAGGMAFDPSRVFDVSRGADVAVPALDLPQTPEEAAASYAMLDQTEARRGEEAQGLFRDANAHLGGAFTGPPVSIVRRNQIMFYASYVRSTPELARLYDAVTAGAAALLATYDRVILQELKAGLDACNGQPFPQDQQCRRSFCIPALAAAHQQWLPQMAAQDAALRAWAQAYYRFATGMAANLADRDAHAYAVLIARYSVLEAYRVYDLGPVELWAFGADNLKTDCIPQPTEPGAETSDATMPDVELCSPALKAVKLTLKIPPLLSLSINCEKVDVEASRGPLSPFVNVSYGFQSRKTTVFAGVKGGIGEIAPFGPSAKGGVYLTFDSSGRLSDTGVRFAVGGGVDSGVGINVGAGQSWNYSFAGAVL